MNEIDRFAALDAALRAAGHLGAAPAPLSGLDYVAPTSVRCFWRDGTDHTAAQALIDGWDWTVRTATEQAREDAAGMLAKRGDGIGVGIRGGDGALWTFGRNDVAEGLWAALQLLAQRAGVAVPTDAEIAAQIAATRTATNAPDPGVPAADVAGRCHVRIGSATIFALIQGLITAGGADPS